MHTNAVEFSRAPSSIHYDVRAAQTMPSNYDLETPSRAGMRRLRTETPPQQTFEFFELGKQLEVLMEKINVAVEAGRYTDALSTLAKIQTLWLQNSDWLLEEVDPELQEKCKLLEEGIYDCARSYFLALTQDKAAVGIWERGFDKYNQSVQDLIQEFPYFDPSMEEWTAMFEGFNHFGKGMIELTLHDREPAIADLQASFNNPIFRPYLSDFDLFNVAFMIKALEQKLDAPLLFIPQDDALPVTYFLTGQYDKFLAWLDASDADSDDVNVGRAACYALMGRYDEAFSLLDPSDDPNLEIFPIIHFLKGDMEQAKQSAFSNAQHIGYLLLQAIEGTN